VNFADVRTEEPGSERFDWIARSTTLIIGLFRDPACDAKEDTSEYETAARFYCVFARWFAIIDKRKYSADKLIDQ
jgi:hypothetical protein